VAWPRSGGETAGFFVSRKQILIALGVVVLVGLGIAAWRFLTPAPAPMATAITGANFEVAPSDHTLGDPKAKVVLIEYAAPVCPHCARFNENVFQQIRKAYVDTGKVLYVFRVFPLHPSDVAAEKLATCMPKDKYFDFIDILFRNQAKWDFEYGVQDIQGGLREMAKLGGMDQAKADACMASTAEEERINKVAIDGQSRYAINSTPSILVDGELQPPPFASEWTFEALSEILNARLAAKK
jgi:protein-disulfide isomerase